MRSWNDIARLFPINQQYTWLNACGTSPAGTPMVEAVTRYMQAYAEHGLLAPGYSYVEMKSSIQGIVSRLIGCQPHEIALVQNTSEAMNLVSLGLDLRVGIASLDVNGRIIRGSRARGNGPNEIATNRKRSAERRGSS